MAKKNTAKDLLWPSDTRILVRAAFLYVGQGSSTILFVREGQDYKTVLMDINMDRKNGGIDVPRLVKDLVADDGLSVFGNTHPHDDHIRGLLELSDQVSIGEVWHSGHKPSKKYGASYEDLAKVIKKVKEAGGTETKLEGSKEAKALGDAQYYVLGPAEYVTDDVNEDEADARYRRIHEQCAVLKFGSGDSWVMIAGDADRDAFEKHIHDYHKDRLDAVALAAPHHGSRTFFKYDEKDEPYLTALQDIAPEFVVVSAPTQEESQHDHPDDDAMDYYEDEVGEGNVLHTGADRFSFVLDIYEDGTHGEMTDDGGDLAAEYGLDDPDDDGGTKTEASGPFVTPRNATGDLTPRKYG